MSSPSWWLNLARISSRTAAVLFVILAIASRYPTTVSATAPLLLTYRVYLPVLKAEPTRSAVTSRIYWGALVDGQPPTTASLQSNGVFAAFEARAHKSMAILHWGQPWQINGSYVPFQTAYFNNTRQHGSIPLLDWNSYAMGGGPIQPDFELSVISSGLHDSYIRKWAQDAKAWGHPFFLRFDPEMNGNWNPWSETVNDNAAGQYVQMWRHVHDIFTSVGVHNVTWVWCPNIDSGTMMPMPPLYPGDAYVDWTCTDGYNKQIDWRSFNTVFTGTGISWLVNTYQELLSLAPNKPIMIGETASLEAGDGGAKKAAWITDAFTVQLRDHLPAIKAVVWFNWDDNSPDYATLPIESSLASTTAFANAIGSGYFAANEFANLNTSPIPPPR